MGRGYFDLLRMNSLIFLHIIHFNTCNLKSFKIKKKNKIIQTCRELLGTMLKYYWSVFECLTYFSQFFKSVNSLYTCTSTCTNVSNFTWEVTPYLTKCSSRYLSWWARTFSIMAKMLMGGLGKYSNQWAPQFTKTYKIHEYDQLFLVQNFIALFFFQYFQNFFTIFS